MGLFSPEGPCSLCTYSATSPACYPGGWMRCPWGSCPSSKPPGAGALLQHRPSQLINTSLHVAPFPTWHPWQLQVPLIFMKPYPLNQQQWQLTSHPSNHDSLQYQPYKQPWQLTVLGNPYSHNSLHITPRGPIFGRIHGMSWPTNGSLNESFKLPFVQ